MQQALNHFLNWYFEVPVSGNGAGLQRTWRLEAAWNWQTTWPLLLVSIFLALTLLLLKKMFKQQPRPLVWSILSLRIFILLVLLLLVFQVQLRTTSSSKPKLLFLVDTSSSMSLSDTYDDVQVSHFKTMGINPSDYSRLELVQKTMENVHPDWWSRLEDQFVIDVINFDSKIGSQFNQSQESATGMRTDKQVQESTDHIINKLDSYQPTGEATDFASAFNALLKTSDDQPASVVLLSDGHPTTGSQQQLERTLLSYSRRKIPIHAIGVGSPVVDGQMNIESVTSESIGFVGERHSVQVMIKSNLKAKQAYFVQLKNPTSSEVLQETPVDLSTGLNTATVMIATPELKPGRNEYALSLVSRSGKQAFNSNRRKLRVWGRTTPLRILFIDHSPRWEFRHVKSSLERDKSISLSTYLIEGDPAYFIEDKTALSEFPADLAAYDGIILGDIDFAKLDHENIVAFLEKRGGLLFLSGTRSFSSISRTSFMANAHPALPEHALLEKSRGISIHLPGEGRAQRLFPEQSQTPLPLSLPHSYTRLDRLIVKPAALTLLEGSLNDTSVNRVPLVLSMRFGNGLVIQHLIDDTWRWREIEEGLIFHKFWGQTVRNLCRRKLSQSLPPLELLTNLDTIFSDQALEVTLIDRNLISGSVLRTVVVLTNEQGQHSELELSRSSQNEVTFQGEINELPPGQYQLSVPEFDQVEGATTGIQVLPANIENQYKPLNKDFMSRIASATKGGYFPLNDFEDLPDALPSRTYSSNTTTRIITLWNRWEFVTLLLCSLGLEWGLRRRFGID